VQGCGRTPEGDTWERNAANGEKEDVGRGEGEDSSDKEV